MMDLSPMSTKPAVFIEYCTVCNFRGRAVWLAQELLAEFEQHLGAITLVPGRGGVFNVRLEGKLLFSEQERGRFPEPRELKDILQQELGLGPAQRHNRRPT